MASQNRFVVQDDFSLGVIAATSRLLQPKNSVQRVNNLFLNTRGALQVIFGSLIQSTPSGAQQTFLDFIEYIPTQGIIQRGNGTQVTGNAASVTGNVPANVKIGDTLIAALAIGGTNVPVGAPANWNLIRRVFSTAGANDSQMSLYSFHVGTLPVTAPVFTFAAAPFDLRIAAYSGVDSVDVSSAATSNGAASITAPAITPTIGNEYQILAIAAATQAISSLSGAPPLTTEWNDPATNIANFMADAQVAVGPTTAYVGTLAGASTSALVTVLLKPSTAPTVGSILGLSLTQLVDVTAGTYGVGTTTTIYTTLTPTLTAFAGKIVLALGNDVVPELWDGRTLTPISNSFTAAGFIPVWATMRVISVGDQVLPTNTTTTPYYFTATKAGTTGGAEPTWPLPTTANPNPHIVDGSVVWQLTARASNDVPNAAFAFNHLDSLWLWGTSPIPSANGIDDPSTIRMSDQGNPNSWNPQNSSFVGKGDGYVPTGGAVFSMSEVGIASTPTLVLFKERATYEVVGAFPLATIQKAKTNRGNVAPLSAQFMASLGGIIRFTHQGFSLYRGPSAEADQLISDGIHDYIWGTPDITPVDFRNMSQVRSAQTFDPDTYLCMIPTQESPTRQRLFCFDSTLKAWTIFNLPIAPNFLMSALKLIEPPSTLPEILICTSADGNVRRFMSRSDTDLDGTAITWTFKTPMLTPKGDIPAYFDRVTLRTTPGIGAPVITAWSVQYDRQGDGTLQTKTLTIPATVPASAAVGITARGMSLTVNGSGPGVIEAVEFAIVPKPPRQMSQV